MVNPVPNPTVAAKQLRVMLRLSAVTALVLAAFAYALVSEMAAAGVLLGGIAGIVGFRMLSSRLQRLSTVSPTRLHATMVLGAYSRLLIYGCFLFAGYLLDRQTLHGFFGALAGLMAARFVSIYSSLLNARRQRNAHDSGAPPES